jgi:hypothetical protein
MFKDVLEAASRIRRYWSLTAWMEFDARFSPARFSQRASLRLLP